MYTSFRRFRINSFSLSGFNSFLSILVVLLQDLKLVDGDKGNGFLKIDSIQLS